MNEIALQHWGIKGMKWGIRRYQNKDGTLTALGRKREREMNNKLKSANKELKALRAENESLKKQASANSRSIDNLSNEEVQARIERLKLEKSYADAYAQVHPNTNKPHPGKEFAKKVLNEAIVPSLVNVGKSAIEKSLKKAFGLEDKPDPNKQLDFATKKAELALKQIDYESKRFELDKKKNKNSNDNTEQKNDKRAKKEAKQDDKEAKQDDKEAKQADKEAKQADKEAKQADKEAKQAEKEAKQAEKEAKRAEKEAKQENESDDKTIYEDPEVIFNPNSRKIKDNWSQSTNQNTNYKTDTIFEAEWWDADTPTSNLRNNEVVWSGRSFVSGLLDEPR